MRKVETGATYLEQKVGGIIISCLRHRSISLLFSMQNAEYSYIKSFDNELKDANKASYEHLTAPFLSLFM